MSNVDVIELLFSQILRNFAIYKSPSYKFTTKKIIFFKNGDMEGRVDGRGNLQTRFSQVGALAFVPTGRPAPAARTQQVSSTLITGREGVFVAGWFDTMEVQKLNEIFNNFASSFILEYSDNRGFYGF